jgi:hypothetical protein
MTCLLLTITEVFTAISQSTAVCRDSVATNYVSGAPHRATPLCAPTTRYPPSPLHPTHSPPLAAHRRGRMRVAGDLASDAYDAPWTCTHKVFGCTDPSMDNYVSFATDSLTSMCQLGGCNDTDANNFVEEATYNDGSCTYDHYGCMVRRVLPPGTHHTA